MKDYEDLGVTYPITIRAYLKALCTKIGLDFDDTKTFPNYDKELTKELYLDSNGESIGYVYRDVLTEIAQATGSTICIDDSTIGGKTLTLRYVYDTEDTIDERFFKDTGVSFGEKFGPINSLVLSRSADSDITNPVEDAQSIAENGICQIKIKDNQIMNWENRETYMQAIFNAINGIEYYINDCSSTGIIYYDLLDKYSVSIGNNTYPCIMFNNEIIIDQGLEERFYADEMEEYVSEITKSKVNTNKVDRISLTVNKQEGIIQSLVDKTVYVSDTKTGVGSITLENAYEGQLYKLSIKGQMNLLFPQSEEGLYGYPLVPSDNLVPSDTLTPSSPVSHGNKILYPSNELFSKSSALLIDDTEYALDFDFLNYINNDVCDEFIYENGTCYIVRRVGIDEHGEKYALDNEIIESRKSIVLNVKANSTIQLKSFDNAILNATYLLDNIYTQNFATEVYVKSEIKQTADSINLEVTKKLDSEDFTGANIILAINKDESQASIAADKISLEGKNIDLSAGEGITISSPNFNVSKTGVVTADEFNSNNANITGGQLVLNDSGQSGINNSKIIVKNSNDDTNYAYLSSKQFFLKRGNYSANLQTGSTDITYYIGNISEKWASVGSDGIKYVTNGSSAFDVDNSGLTFIRNGVYINWGPYSLEELKENISKTKISALDLIDNTDIYEYKYKEEKENEKKHIGVIIGEKYKTPTEIISNDGKSIDLYSMISLSWKAIQEQQEIIEQLKERIEKLERESGK